MDMEQGDLGVRLQGGPDVDDEELAELTSRLRNELLDLDVDDVVPQAGSGEAPAASKGVAMGAIGGLLVQFAVSPEGLRSVVSGVRSWLSRQHIRSVKLSLDGDTCEVSGLDSDEQKRLVDLWIVRHAGEG
jgi:hypothetical protein